MQINDTEAIRDRMEHVQQVNDHTCVHACMAMVTGQTIEYYIERFGDHALGFDELVTVMVENRLFPETVHPHPHDFPVKGLYLVVAPSKNLPGKSHQIVVWADQNGFDVFDPQRGREGREYWTGEDIMDGSMSRCEVLYLNDMTLRKMLPIKEDIGD